MKIIIEGEVKEIAALERELRDGDGIKLDGKIIAKIVHESRKGLMPYDLPLAGDSTKDNDGLADGPHMDCPRKWD